MVALPAEATVTWTHPEPDSVDGYKVYYGNESNSYMTWVDSGNFFEQLLTDLIEGKTYYVAATAYRFSGEESIYSNEVSYLVPLPDSPLPDPEDIIPPVIDIIGDTTVNIVLNSVYLDLGALAFDETDGNLTAFLIISSTVDTSKTGKYTVTYIVYDFSGNKTTAIRKVNVRRKVGGKGRKGKK